jgi:putative proteasome-type protease
MTYCLGIKLNNNIILMSDSRTSAGVDNISTYSKMWRFGQPGERQLVLCSAGNLATTQAVIATLKADMEKAAPINLMSVNTMHEGAEYLGKVIVECQTKNTGGGSVFETTFLLGGEILGSEPALHMVYAQGNHITSSPKVPYLQIGEFKYGKPILERVVQEDMPLDRAVVCALISMDATLKSNLTVGPPVELCVLDIGSLQPGRYIAFEEDDAYMAELRRAWDILMEEAMDKLQSPNWMSAPA